MELQRLTTKALMQALRSCLALALSVSSLGAAAQDDDVAKKLANPIASLISVPMQFKYDRDYGANDAGERLFVNI